MTRLSLALAASLALWLAPVAAATTTNVTALSLSAFTDLGAGPMYLGASGAAVVYEIADSQPAANASGFVVQVGDPPVPIQSTSHVWAKSAGANAGSAVVAAPGLTQVAAGQFPFTPLSPSQHNVSITAATGLTPPTGATYAVVQVKNSAGSYETDGVTTPTLSSGFALSVGTPLSLSGAAVIAGFKIIGPSGATMDVGYFK